MGSGWKRSFVFGPAAACFALAGLALTVVAQVPSGRQVGERHEAPDGAFAATIVMTAAGESELLIGPSRGAATFRKSFASTDGEHGARITKGEWTADSRFFVVMLELSGGHSPWHRPMYFWDRKDGRLYSLDDRVGGILGGFALASPDIVSGTVLGDPNDPGFAGSSVSGVPFSVGLSRAVLRPERASSATAPVQKMADKISTELQWGHAREGL